MLDLAIVIVTWNVRDLVLDALAALNADLVSSGLDARILVVDSASDDGTVQAVQTAFPHVQVIALTDNVGFARANNHALRVLGFDVMADDETPDMTPPMTATTSDALPRAVYLLNPDTLTEPGATRVLFDALLANAGVGLVGARLTYGDGTFQHSAFAFPGLRQLWVEFFPVPGRWIDGRFNGRYPRSWYAAGQPFAVDFVLGATMMLRREVIQATRGFDPGYFMYCEEVDWAWRIQAAGWRVLCAPAAHVVHLGGQSSGQVKAASLVHLWTSRLKLFDHHYPAWKRELARRLVAAGLRRKLRHLPHPAPPDLLAAYTDILNRATHP